MLPKPYMLRGNSQGGPCVVKIEYGMFNNKAERAIPKPYVIAKMKKQAAGLKSIEDSLNAFIRGGKNNPSGIYYHLFNYVRDNPGQDFRIETLSEKGDSGYKLLKLEQEKLDECITNPLCLNNQVEAYIPAFDEETQAYGWISKQNVMLFQKFMKARKKKSRSKPAATEK